MKSSVILTPLTLAALVVSLSLVQCEPVFGHDDGMDGPVGKAAQKALDAGNVNVVLIWVQKKDEAEVRTAFQKSLAVRKLSPEAQALADRYFFETVVRLHRAGEGAPYTGLKSASRDLGPAIPAADKAIEDGSLEQVQFLLANTIQEGISKRSRKWLPRRTSIPKTLRRGESTSRRMSPSSITSRGFTEQR